MAEKMRVLIGGGLGFVGRHLRAWLTENGYQVTCISRTSAPGCITWTQLIRKGLPECEAVVNLAGKNILDPLSRDTPLFKEEVYSSRIDTTENLANLIREAKIKPKVFVTTSAVGYYPPSLTAEYDEDSPGGDFDFLSRLCNDWEEVAKLEPEHNVRQATVRLGVVLGRDGGAIKTMFFPFFLGAGGRIGSGKQWFPWIHVGDAAGIYAHVIENEEVSGTLNGTSPNPVTNSAFTAAFGKAMWRPTFFPLPEFAVNLMYGPDRAKILTQGQKVMPKRTLESGYKFLFPEIDAACVECSVFLPDLKRLLQR